MSGEIFGLSGSSSDGETYDVNSTAGAFFPHLSQGSEAISTYMHIGNPSDLSSHCLKTLSSGQQVIFPFDGLHSYCVMVKRVHGGSSGSWLGLRCFVFDMMVLVWNERRGRVQLDADLWWFRPRGRLAVPENQSTSKQNLFLSTSYTTNRTTETSTPRHKHHAGYTNGRCLDTISF
jgi:hypothetical protein